jgi:hypothetical protein
MSSEAFFMNRRVSVLIGCVILWVTVLATWAGARSMAQNPPAATAQRGGSWTIPPTATEEKSPLTVNPGVIASGKNSSPTSASAATEPREGRRS